MFSGFLHFWWHSFVETVPACQNCLTGLSAKRSKYYQQKKLTELPPATTTVPSGTKTVIWSIGIPVNTFGSTIQARAIPPPSWSSAPQVTTGRLLSPKREFPRSTLQKRRLSSLFTIIFRDYSKKGLMFNEI